jgi:hypothetical protein
MDCSSISVSDEATQYLPLALRPCHMRSASSAPTWRLGVRATAPAPASVDERPRLRELIRSTPILRRREQRTAGVLEGQQTGPGGTRTSALAVASGLACPSGVWHVWHDWHDVTCLAVWRLLALFQSPAIAPSCSGPSPCDRAPRVKNDSFTQHMHHPARHGELSPQRRAEPSRCRRPCLLLVDRLNASRP